jgi:hypothetical protein
MFTEISKCIDKYIFMGYKVGPLEWLASDWEGAAIGNI